ncbi:MAG: hypothetical protein ACOVN7_07065 [Rubrivivax sp.]|jgi:hypothetical protein
MWPNPYRTPVVWLALGSWALALAACGGGQGSETTPAPTVDRLLDFAGSTNCTGADADYTASTAPTNTVSGATSLPAPFAGSGWRLSGTNRSDDLFIYVKCKLTGLQAGQTYRAGFSVTMLTDAPTGCIGVGGAPGEGVTLHAGVSNIEPLTQLQNSGYYRVNLDRGNQSVGGSQSQALGHIGNGVSSCSQRQFAEKTLAPAALLLVQANAQGEVWLHTGIDSGFESYSEVYLRQVSVRFSASTP